MANVAHQQVAQSIVDGLSPLDRQRVLCELATGNYRHNGRRVDGLDPLGAALESAIKLNPRGGAELVADVVAKARSVAGGRLREWLAGLPLSPAIRSEVSRELGIEVSL